MASVNEQMDDLLTSNSAEKNKDMSMSDIFSFDRFKKEALPQFRDKEEIIEKATASGTGLLTGTLGLPSDIVSLASTGADVADKYIDNPTVTVMKDFLNRAEQEIGRPAFDKKFTEITGLESNPENIDQLIGEIISPTGAFLVPLKTLNKLFTPIKKGMSEFFNNMPTGGGSLKSANNAPIQPVKKDESIDPNRPIINLSEVGIKAPDGLAASKTYEKLETDAMGGSYSEEKYKSLSLDEKDRLYKETGVYRGQDGKLRYKIPTADFQLNEGYLKELDIIEGGFNSKNIPPEGITLEQMLNAKDLYRNYATPAANGDYGLLKDIRIKNFDSYAKEKNLNAKEAMTELENTQAIYSRHEGTETIYVRGGLKSNVREDLLHEIQHAIQHREGFNAGSSPNRFLTDTSTEFGQRYNNTLQEVYTAKRNALSTFEQTVVDGKRANINFLQNKELFESVTDKLVKREYTTLLKTYNKTNADGYFDELPAGIRYLQRKDMLVDPPMIVRGESKPFVYPGYDTRNVKFNDNERNLANILSDNESFQNYIRDRILIEHKARNLKLMETVAHKEYIKVPGEVQARKIVEDDVTYRNIVKQLKEQGEPIPTDPKERDILINRIFRSRFMKPSEKGVLQGQGVKVDSGGNTTSPLDGDEMSVIDFPTTPRDRIKAKRKFDSQKRKTTQVEDARVSDEQMKLQNMKIAEAHAPLVKLIGAEETNKILTNKGSYNIVRSEGNMPENSLLLKNLSDRYIEETISKLQPDVTWTSLPDAYKQKPFKKYNDGDVLRNADGETIKIELTSHLPVKDKKLHKSPNVVNVHLEYYVEPTYLFKYGDEFSYARLTDLEANGFKKVSGKPDLSVVSDTTKNK